MERVDALTQEVKALRQQIAPDGKPSLSDRIDHLTRVVDHQASVVDRRTSWWRAAVAIGVVLVFATTGGAFLLELRTRSEITDANRKLCPLVALMIPDVGGREPTTEYGRQIADQARLAYGCAPKGAPNG
jgi:hypothetical protein